jgi:phage antirepressor YoqD-like protein
MYFFFMAIGEWLAMIRIKQPDLFDWLDDFAVHTSCTIVHMVLCSL